MPARKCSTALSGHMSRARRTLGLGLPSIVWMLVQLANPSVALAATLALEWDPSPDPVVSAYRLYRGTSSQHYDWSLDLANITAIEVSDLTPGGQYYFAVTAIDEAGLESEPSNEVAYVVPSNHPPIAISQSNTVLEDSSINLVLQASDPDGDPLHYVVHPPAHGRLTGTPPDLSYQPDLNYTGTDSFQFTAGDGQLVSSVATVTLEVVPVNDLPVALGVSLTTTRGSSIPIVLTATDVDSALLHFQITRQPINGKLTGIPPNLTYSPKPQFTGLDYFTFTAFDGVRYSAPATVVIQILDRNQAPVGKAQVIPVTEDAPTPVALMGSDPDGDPISFAVVAHPKSGTFSGPPLTYTPKANFNGNDSFYFVVSDGRRTSTPVKVDLRVIAINDAPRATGQSVSTVRDTPLSILLSGSDVDAGERLTFAIQRNPTSGTLSGLPPNMVYRPKPGFVGVDFFDFSAGDGKATSARARIRITVR